MRNGILIGALMLASCMDPTQEANDQYNMMERAGASPSELCEASKKIAAAYLEKKDENGYRLYKGASDARCMAIR